MSAVRKAVLITGATGKQGGAVINALLKQKADFEILAVTRNAQSASAQRLLQRSPNIKLVTGDLNDSDAIFHTAGQVSTAPVWGVFSVQTPPMGFNVPEGIEETQGNGLIDAAIKANVQHFVYSSVDRGGEKSDDTPTDIPHFIAKHNVERHLFTATKTSNMTWTLIRPVAFFENLAPGFLGKVFSTSFEMSLRKDQKLQLIATSDIGYFAARALMEPQQFSGKKLSIAGDEMTYSEFKATFEATTKQTLPTTYWFIARVLHWMTKELGYMFRWFREVGYDADIARTREMNPEMKDFKTWLQQESQFR